jgi:hypothetical protein
VAITVFVTLNLIGCGLYPKGAGFHLKNQALIPEMAFKSSSANSVAQQGSAFGS